MTTIPKPDRDNPIHAPGYRKDHGKESEPNEMIVEVQSQVRHRANRAGGKSDASIFLRIGVAPEPRVPWRIHNLVENCADLTLDQARALAEWLLSEAKEAQEDLDRFS